MKIKLYNTLTRKKEEFKPIKKGQVKMYVCGPTVYWYQHIGNLRSYIFADVLRRILEFNNYKVKEVMNVTDVGHLTSDSDTGEDKIEAAAKKECKDAKDIANYYWKIFKNDFKKLNIQEPDIWCKATEHIKDQIAMIQILEKKGYTYKTKDGIYFDTSRLKDYGKLARLDIQGLKAGKRISLGEKKHKTDFALWKFSPKPGVRQQEWESPWAPPGARGKVMGFPGWHIECSAMSSKYLGDQFDIHTGGIDHVGVHHTNEIAQSEAAFEKRPWVRYWLHGNFLTAKGKKVSKSKGGLYTIQELEGKGFAPLSYRYFTFSAHYRTKLNFNLKALIQAQNSYQRLKRIIFDLKNDGQTNKKYLDEFTKAINNDLDIPRAMAVLWELVRDREATGKINTIKQMDKVLVLDLAKKDKLIVPNEIQTKLRQMDQAREKNDFKKADQLRAEIIKAGYKVKNTLHGSVVERI